MTGRERDPVRCECYEEPTLAPTDNPREVVCRFCRERDPVDALLTAAEIQERIADAQYVLDNADAYDVEARVDASRSKARNLDLLRYAARVEELEAAALGGAVVSGRERDPVDALALLDELLSAQWRNPPRAESLRLALAARLEAAETALTAYAEAFGVWEANAGITLSREACAQWGSIARAEDAPDA